MSKCCEKSIQEAAYYLWQNSGCPTGQDEYFWALASEQCGKTSCSSKKSCSTSAAKKSTTTTKKAAPKATAASKAPVKKTATKK